MFLKPVNELKVVYLQGNNFQVLPPEGKDVPEGDLFWARRIKDGDVELTTPVKVGE